MTDDEAVIRALIDDWANAICRGDLDRIVADRTHDLVMFDVPEPLRQTGIDAYRETWSVFFRHNPPGPDRFRIGELEVVAGDEVAYAHGLLTIGGGDAHCRLSLGLRRIDGRWRVGHEHHSIPIRLS